MIFKGVFHPFKRNSRLTSFIEISISKAFFFKISNCTQSDTLTTFFWPQINDILFNQLRLKDVSGQLIDVVQNY